MSAAPYPADTRAKGWRFEIDYEQVEQSETWQLANEVPIAQAALTMMWLMAWRQKPCGSFPNDENSIRAICRLPAEVWAQVRALCMRGWWLADDGRLYHPTVTARVLEMLRKRRSDADRQAEKRARDAAESDGTPAESYGVTPESRVTSRGLGSESATYHLPPTKEKEEKTPRKRAPSCPEGVAEQVWSDWLDLRRQKRAPVTQTVIEGAREQAEKAGMTLEAFLRVWCRRGTQGMEADWIKPHERGQPAETAWQRSQRERVAEMTGGLASAKPPGQRAQQPSIVEVFDVAARRLG